MFWKRKPIKGIDVPITFEDMETMLEKHDNKWDYFVDFVSKKWVEKDAVAYGLYLSNFWDYQYIPHKKFQFLGIYQAYNLSLNYILEHFPNQKLIYDMLPDKITIYRAGYPFEIKRGANLNWSLSRHIAEQHAFEIKKNNIVLKAHVPKDLIMMMGCDAECEILIHVPPEKIQLCSVKSTEFLNGDWAVKDINSNINLLKLPTRKIHYQAYSFLQTDISFTSNLEYHGVRHTLRVLYYSLILGEVMELTEDELLILAYSSIFHDTRRCDEYNDKGHGKRAAEYYRQICDSNKLKFYEEAYWLIYCHDLNDDKGYDMIRSSASKNLERAIVLYQIFKDADALDRFRFGSGACDKSFLRTEFGKEMIDFCKHFSNETDKRSIPKGS